jgi:hypothetical protein
MSDVDLNLLVALDMLLTERSVTRAAVRLNLSHSAMSRSLARLRVVTGDPLLVRAGRGLVPTPRALELVDHVHAVTRDALAVLRPQISQVDMASVELTFTVRASESFMKWLSGPVVKAVLEVAPGSVSGSKQNQTKTRSRCVKVWSILRSVGSVRPPPRSAHDSCSMINTSAWRGLAIRFWRTGRSPWSSLRLLAMSLHCRKETRSSFSARHWGASV